MKHGIDSQSQQGTLGGRRVPLVLIVLAVVGALTILTTWRRAPDVSIHQADTSSRYKNTRPGVKYVGDAACSRCHAQIAETFRRHPMGRSLSPIAAAPMRFDEAGDRVLFEARGLQYSIENRDGRVIHQETRRETSGRIIARNEAEVQFAVGSGRLGVAYLIEHDGFLFQSPIAWYPRERQWDLPPGYQTSNSHFDRPITPSCLFCHANQVEPVPDTVNRYRPPIFRGHAIGCERCHGPGELHVTHPTAVDGRDGTIVNPALLEPSHRDAVCEQCHLNGQWRELRAGRHDEDFRPGLPFYRFWTVLERAGAPAKDDIVGQFEQMHESPCFLASGGRLGCISCHDPHRAPTPEEKVTYFRDRCLECHASRGCSLAVSVRLGRSPDDDCTSCHMPHAKGSNTIHVAVTNHRIPRHADQDDRSPVRTEGPRDSQRPLVNYHRDLMDDRERAQADREVGVALCRAGREGAAVALPFLEEALAARPGDVIAWEAKGFALGLLRQGKEGLEAFRTALTVEPDRESALTGAAYLAAKAGQPLEAVEYWRRAIAKSPWRSDYRAELALLCFQVHDWRAAADACRAALRLNPTNIQVRKLLVRCYLRLGDPQAARDEFETLMGFDLPDRDELLRWFAPLTRPR
jgi:predicted CXXCH cytochrome family protein